MKTLYVKSMDVFIDLNFPITSIIGSAKAGKTFLAKKLCNKIDNSDVLIDDMPITSYDYKFLRSNIVVVLDDNNFKKDLVLEELYYYLNIVEDDYEEIREKVEDIATYFKIKKLLDKQIYNLYLSDRILIKILALLIINPSVIIVDNLLSYLDKDKFNLLLKYIKSNNIKLVNLTTNTEELLISDNIIVIDNLKKVLSGDTKEILEGNSILPYLGFKLPFITELSNNLMLYNVVDKIYYDYRKLVNNLWK